MRQSAGWDGSGGEEEEREYNPDWAAGRDDGWAANRKQREEEGKMEIRKASEKKERHSKQVRETGRS